MTIPLPFARLWAERHRESLEETRLFWDQRADEFNDITHDPDREERMELVRLLAERGALRPDFSVLDIGCGAGRHALEFGPMVRAVTGIDISPRMIDHAKANAESRGLDNIRFLALPWQELDIDACGFRGAFDLVFDSMSPAVDSEAALLKMHAASRGHCFLSGFIHRADTLLHHLAERIVPGSAPPPHEGSIYYAFNVLWQHGIFADVICKNLAWDTTWDIAHAVAVYSEQLHGLLPDKQELEAALTRHIEALAIDGKLRRRSEAKVAWLFWQV